jgi:hypothetical protein
MPRQTEHTRYDKVISGEIQGSASAAQCPDLICRAVTFKANADNVGNVYIGGAGVTIPDGTTDTTSGVEMQPGDWMQFNPCSNINIFYYICDNTGDDFGYLAML